MNRMIHKVIEQWNFNGICVLRLDKGKVVSSPKDDYRSYRIDGVIYKPVSMSHPSDNFVALKGTGNFVGKEVEFIKEDTQ